MRDRAAATTPLVVTVLGMHRSGTSCLAGCLEEAGLALGQVNRRAPHNRKGNRESPRIMALHDDLLADNGGSWDDPPDEVAWSDEHRRRRDEIIDAYEGFPAWGFKDPRTLLALEGWLEALPDLRCVGSFRDPRRVAASLTKRDGSSSDSWLRLWTHYNRLLLHHHERLQFELISFDLPPASYRARVTGLAEKLGLEPPAEGFGFFEPRLRSARGRARLALPPEVSELYERLLQAGRSADGRC